MRDCEGGSNLMVKSDGETINVAGQEGTKPSFTRKLQVNSYLTQSISYMVSLKSPPPQNRQLIVLLVLVNNKLTILWGS